MPVRPVSWTSPGDTTDLLAIDKIDPELLQKAQTQFAGFNGASGGICPVAKLEKLMNPNPLNTKPVVFVFKKGLNTNWTWGVLDDVDEVYREFLIRDPWKAGTVNQPLFCDGGDCGSIVFGTSIILSSPVPDFPSGCIAHLALSPGRE